MNDQLIAEARALKERLNTALYACYEWHPHLGDVPMPKTNRRRMKIKRLLDRAQRRINRRLHMAGYHIPISRAFAMWVINDVYKPGK